MKGVVTKQNIIREKSYQFALKAIDVYKFLTSQKREFVLSKQLLKSSTSIGANVEEAIGAYSVKDFNAKISIAYKETRETRYWINLLKDSQYIESKAAEIMLQDVNELCRLLGKIFSTTKKRLNNQIPHNVDCRLYIAHCRL